MSQPVSILYTDQTPAEVAVRIQNLLQTKERVFVAIDGNCCAGKTTFASRLSALLPATVLHMDDYFLQPHMRTPERLLEPGGNVDAERFLAEALLPLSQGLPAQMRRYDCREDALLPAVALAPERVIIVEGAYSLHPLLKPYYHIKIFCRVGAAEQIARVRARNGADAVSVFLNRWIPLENLYFESLGIPKQCDWIIDTTC